MAVTLAAIRDFLKKEVGYKGQSGVASESGVSTNTLRVLLKGEEDVFKKIKEGTLKKRIAWVRSISRLASQYGQNPEEWVQAIGLEVDETIHSVIKKVQKNKLISNKYKFHRINLLYDIERRRKEGDDLFPVKVGAVMYYPFCTNLSTGKSFFAEFVQRLIGIVDPSLKIAFVAKDEILEVIDGILSDPPEYHLAPGVFDCTARRLAGMDFIDIPGWEIRLSALWIDAGNSKIPTWKGIVTPGEKTGLIMVVIKGEAGHLYLEGPCQIESESIILCQNMKPEVVADKFYDEYKKRIYKSVIFVADEETCRQVKKCLLDKKIQESVLELVHDPDCTPKYALSIAIRAKDSLFYDLLKNAQKELFSNSPLQMAYLYADLLVEGWRSRNVEIDPEDKPRSTFKLVEDSQSRLLNSTFKKLLANFLLEKFLKDIPTFSDNNLGDVRKAMDHVLPPEWASEIKISIEKHIKQIK